MAEQDRIESGTDRERAHYEARKEFGNVMLTTEAVIAQVAEEGASASVSRGGM